MKDREDKRGDQLLDLEEEHTLKDKRKDKKKKEAVVDKAQKEETKPVETGSREVKVKTKAARTEREVDKLARGELRNLPQKSELDRSQTVLNGLINLKRQLDQKDPTHKVTEFLGETIIDLQKAIDDYEEAAGKDKGEDENALAEAKLLRRTAEELKLLSDEVIPSKLFGLFSDIMLPSVDKIVREHLKNKVVQQYIFMVDDNDRDTFRSDLSKGFEYIARKARVVEGQVYEKLNPVSGLIIMTAYIRKSHLGDESKKEVRQEYFFTGEVKPQTDDQEVTFNYLLTAVGGGFLKFITMAGPVPFAKQPLIFNWSLADAGANTALGFSKAGFVPTEDQMLDSLDQAKKAQEKNCGYVFVGSINNSQIKDVYIVDTENTLKYSFWDEKHEKDKEAYKGRFLSDPFQVVYIVVPSDNSRLDKENVNKRKIAFYSEEAAKNFAELYQKHPYWYDPQKGWNLHGWEEKMTARDHAVLAIEDILRTYLTPGIFTDFDLYFNNPQNLSDLPIYAELVKLNDLVTYLTKNRSDNLSDEDRVATLKDITQTFDQIKTDIKGKDFPYDGYGLTMALSKAQDFIEDKFGHKPPRDEVSMNI